MTTGLAALASGTAVGQATGGGVLAPNAVPLVAAALAGLAALGALLGAARTPGRRRGFAIGGMLVAAVIAAGHVAIAADGPQSAGVSAAEAAAVARLAAYALGLAVAVGLLGRIGAAGRWRAAGLGAGALVHAGGIAGWLLLDPPIALGALAVAALAGLLVFGTIPLLATRELGARRRGLYVELAGIVSLTWAGALGAIVLGPHVLDVLDPYVALVVGAYADVLFAAGVGYLLVARGDGVDRTLGVPTQPASDAVAAPPPDADDAGVEPGVGADADGGTASGGD